MSDDAVKRPSPEFVMERNGNRQAALWRPLLHYGVTTTLADPFESVLFKNTARCFTR